MDVSKKFYDEERKFYFEIKEGCVLCKNILLTDLSGSQYLFEILQTSLTVKNSESVVKSWCFEKYSRWRAPIFFGNEGGI